VSSFGWQKTVHVRTLNYPRPIPSMLEIPPDEKARGLKSFEIVPYNGGAQNFNTD
jgi:hypothetical protein